MPRDLCGSPTGGEYGQENTSLSSWPRSLTRDAAEDLTIDLSSDMDGLCEPEADAEGFARRKRPVCGRAHTDLYRDQQLDQRSGNRVLCGAADRRH